jgi:tetratricopeptide (TPR) repeat protein
MRASKPSLVLVVLIGLSGVVFLSRWIEQHRPRVEPSDDEQTFYTTAPVARRLSLGFNGLVADWYWMRSLQYVGRKTIAYAETHPGNIQLDDLSALDLKTLPKLLDFATTLDPQFIAVYEYGGVLLPSINEKEAIHLLKKGIAANPDEWRLYHHLGYIYWQSSQFPEAAAVYAQGAKAPGAPAWLEALAAKMNAEGGSRATAREMYQRLDRESDDQFIREMAHSRLLQLQSFDERDLIRKLLSAFSAKTGHCPQNWKMVADPLRRLGLAVDERSGEPIDPAGFPYVLTQNGCDVDLGHKSLVPYK